jgi:RNA polymerase sigma-70 factor (ECF subfamily)
MNPPPQLDTVVQELTRHQPRLRGFIRCLLLEAEHVEDVLQETNMVLWRKANEFQPGTDFWKWASQVARFQVLSHWKRRNRDRHVFDLGLVEELATLVEKTTEEADLRQAALKRCLEKLPSPQRQLLDMRYSQQQSVEQITAAIGRPNGSIRQTLYRIREALLRCIEKQFPGEA